MIFSLKLGIVGVSLGACIKDGWIVGDDVAQYSGIPLEIKKNNWINQEGYLSFPLLTDGSGNS